jgi:hypothetical protein
MRGCVTATAREGGEWKKSGVRISGKRHELVEIVCEADEQICVQ